MDSKGIHLSGTAMQAMALSCNGYKGKPRTRICEDFSQGESHHILFDIPEQTTLDNRRRMLATKRYLRNVLAKDFGLGFLYICSFFPCYWCLLGGLLLLLLGCCLLCLLLLEKLLHKEEAIDIHDGIWLMARHGYFASA